LLCNAVAAALKVPGQVTVSATIEEDSQARYCRISITNPGTLSPAMRDSILQRQPVLRQDGQYGTGLLAAGELLGVLRGHLQYPKTAPGVVQAAALLTLGGDQT
jgi:anti-sigma regulatory factor (Ser/Thr protein kinase)